MMKNERGHIVLGLQESWNKYCQVTWDTDLGLHGEHYHEKPQHHGDIMINRKAEARGTRWRGYGSRYHVTRWGISNNPIGTGRVNSRSHIVTSTWKALEFV
jgi:hypothetical protein